MVSALGRKEVSRTANKKENKKSLGERMYRFFAGYPEEYGAPSFSKFAVKEKMTVSDIEALREDAEFEKAYKECIEIRRDYLKDQALSKRFDASTVKFLLAEEYTGNDAPREERNIEFTLKVLRSENEA